MNIFDTRNKLIADYVGYVSSFINIRDARIKAQVQESLDTGALWPEPLVQLNPSFERGGTIDELVAEGTLHQECANVFRIKSEASSGEQSTPLRLHRHQSEAVRIARGGHNYVLTTGTGSGKSLSYIIPIVDHVLRNSASASTNIGSGSGTVSGGSVKAIVVYPMNALANSQAGELRKFLELGYPNGRGPVTFARYTGQETDQERMAIMANPPDILLTNYVMLELILTRPIELPLVKAAQGLQFLVLDELHTYRGRQGADVAFLIRRVRERLNSPHMQIVGTSATLAGAGSYQQQKADVSAVASRLFGTPVQPEHVVGETLRRATPERSIEDPQFMEELARRVRDESYQSSREFEEFVRDPLASWIEGEFGVSTESESGRLVRNTPQGLLGEEGAATKLSKLIGVPIERCAHAIQATLLAGYECGPNPETGFAPFAFRLHQFISRGDAVYTSLEPEDRRHITVYGQQYKPGSRDHVLLPLVFCRECGQEYYCVRRSQDPDGDGDRYVRRDIGDLTGGADGDPGFLYFSQAEPWPSDEWEILARLPQDWLEDAGGGDKQLVAARKKDLPQAVRVLPNGTDAGPGGGGGEDFGDGLDEGNVTRSSAQGRRETLVGHFLPAPFRFCLHCGVSYNSRQRNDFSKLALLSSEGRSTATTVLSLSVVRQLRQSDLPPQARKLLSFLDNRQDASLQAGHFNDFVEIGILRSALYRAASEAEGVGLSHEALTQTVFDALDLPVEAYAVDPEVRFQALKETQRALRDMLGYRLYRDLKRGWRITSPNLEQSGLLEIEYLSLTDVCEAEDVWEGSHQAFREASPQTRAKIAKVLLDYMRRELAIKVDYLDPRSQEKLQQQSNQRLIAPWALDENEALEYASVLYPRSRRPKDARVNLYLSPKGGFGQYLRRSTTFAPKDSAGGTSGGTGVKLSMEDIDRVIKDLLEGLRLAGLVEVVAPPEGNGDVPGYQLPASAMLWKAGEGTRAYHDPIRVPNQSRRGAKPNAFFGEFYRTVAAGLQGLQAREHTAQVPYELREEREEQFRSASLPILFCSPTMELGVDISELNVVNMRNVPPTPANYAQRSGRAGRSGQPALVFTYCTTGSPHDQYFFRHPERMVAGAVAPPRLDLANEDLVRAHVHALWLAETGQSLGKSLKDILDLSGEPPSLQLAQEVQDSMKREAPRQAAHARAKRVLATLGEELTGADWYSQGWLDEVLTQVALRFDATIDRWRSLYRAAKKQFELQNKIIGDPTRSLEDKNVAKRLRREAEAQIDLLTEVANVAQSDFYSYRYFASEGFLPGYSFPRLPISAFIPARRMKQQDEFLSRPRFLAVSEFGPRSVLYHEGSRYLINKVILPVAEDEQGEEQSRVLMSEAKLCNSCGYVHPIQEGKGPDLCERCDLPLDGTLKKLFRMQNVSTMRRDKINSDEEERTRQGYEIVTAVRFGEHDGQPAYRKAAVMGGDEEFAELSYGHTATIWRINMGWTRRQRKEQLGFVLDTERGYWSRDEQMEDEDLSDPISARTERVIPFVEDRRNCLLLEPTEAQEPGILASLMSALKNAVQVLYQLEDSELAVEALPTRGDPRLVLFYEAAEGGAGVLRRLLDDPAALSAVAQEALRICHFDPDTGEDLHRAPRSREDCEAACYDCLMSYSNQRDHHLLDRHAIRDLLLTLAGSRVDAAPTPMPRAEHLRMLMRLTGSELEREWLRELEKRGLRLPEKAQHRIEVCKTRPDFLYDGDHSAAIYIDGTIHTDYEHRRARDEAQTETMMDYGYTVIRFRHNEEWDAIFAKYPFIFGKEK